MCALVMSTSAWPAPAPPPPSVWKQNACCASPVIVPSAKRSNSTQPQKPPSSSPQKDGLLQLPEIPICHVVACATAVGTCRRGEPRRHDHRSGKRRQPHNRSSHCSPLSRFSISPKGRSGHPEGGGFEGQVATRATYSQ